ncbi:hypothetical protein IW261DRAFT_1509229 [Armillaria novae-zelandiae]|uniref:F-box domain-containing protein n=1 Tax=Armillaria novae-zelandiae TaxID=153914 RepID=A0AA39NUS6_9AGAR|nr:hypothetical protein IW261DRAFT_1509229 [Armillaria novae-zelandiae]
MRLSLWRSPIRNSPLVTSLLIATVCSYWRSICLSLPQLWSIMFVDADEIFTSIISRKVLQKFRDTIGTDDDDDIPLTCL